MSRRFGWDTDFHIQDVASAAENKWGTNDNPGSFWIRYLTPSPGATHRITADDAVNELRGAWDNGQIYLVPNSEPSQDRLNGSQAMGQSDAADFCNAITNVFNAVGPLRIATSGQVHVYLSLEYSTNLSVAYWNAWASYIDSYQIGGGAHLYPGMYCAPNSPALNCSQVTGIFCFSIWSSTPEPCADCAPFGSVSWNADQCYNTPSGDVGPTLVWQMAEQGVCQDCHPQQTWPHVDADMTSPNNTETDNMLYLNSRP